MSDHFNVIVVAWMFLLLIGAWVLVNALIDLGAKRVRHWIASHWLGDPTALGVQDETRGPR